MNITLNTKACNQLQAIKEELNMSEQDIVHVAIQRLLNEIFLKQEPDDGPLSEEDLKAIQAKADEYIKGPVVFEQFMFKMPD